MNEQPSPSATEFVKSHYKTPALVEHGTRCGKPNCRCAGSGHRHPTAYLYWRDATGRAHRRYVRKAEVERVRELVQLRQAIDRQQRQTLADARAYLRELRQFEQEYQRW